MLEKQNKIKLTLTVTPEVRAMLAELSEYRGKSISRLVAETASVEYKRMNRKRKKKKNDFLNEE